MEDEQYATITSYLEHAWNLTSWIHKITEIYIAIKKKLQKLKASCITRTTTQMEQTLIDLF